MSFVCLLTWNRLTLTQNLLKQKTMSINKVILLGHVGKDPDVRYLDGGIAVATFPLATTERAIPCQTEQTCPNAQTGTTSSCGVGWHNLQRNTYIKETNSISKASCVPVPTTTRTVSGASQWKSTVKRWSCVLPVRQLHSLNNRHKSLRLLQLRLRQTTPCLSEPLVCETYCLTNT